MTFVAKGPPPGGEGSPLESSSYCGVDLQANIPNQAPPQEQNQRNPRAVREATIASILDESAYLLGGLTVHASIAQQFADLGDVRGFLYSLDQVVKQAIRAGTEGVELRKIRAQSRAAGQ